jgi:hypothetical protein
LTYASQSYNVDHENKCFHAQVTGGTFMIDDIFTTATILLGGAKGGDFWEILGERVGGTHFVAREREEMV